MLISPQMLMHSGALAGSIVDPDRDAGQRPATDAPRPSSKIPRPANSWILYRTEMRPLVVQQLEDEGIVFPPETEISKRISAMWHNCSSHVRLKYEQAAERAVHEHRMRYPSYRFQPLTKKQKKDAVEERKRAAKEKRQLEREAIANSKHGPLLLPNPSGHISYVNASYEAQKAEMPFPRAEKQVPDGLVPLDPSDLDSPEDSEANTPKLQVLEFSTSAAVASAPQEDSTPSLGSSPELPTSKMLIKDGLGHPCGEMTPQATTRLREKGRRMPHTSVSDVEPRPKAHLVQANYDFVGNAMSSLNIPEALDEGADSTVNLLGVYSAHGGTSGEASLNLISSYMNASSAASSGSLNRAEQVVSLPVAKTDTSGVATNSDYNFEFEIPLPPSTLESDISEWIAHWRSR